MGMAPQYRLASGQSPGRRVTLLEKIAHPQPWPTRAGTVARLGVDYSIHFERRTSKLPQTGHVWCCTSSGVSQARHTYGGRFPSPSMTPDISFALFRTPIGTTRPRTTRVDKKEADSLRHFFPVMSCGFVPLPRSGRPRLPNDTGHSPSRASHTRTRVPVQGCYRRRFAGSPARNRPE
jgi:hypothetical protein